MISKRGLFEREAQFPDARTALQVWFDVASEVNWVSLDDIRKTFPATDMVGKKLAIFNIKGNHYRLIVRVELRTRRIYIKKFLTHLEYDRKGWLKWLQSTIPPMQDC